MLVEFKLLAVCFNSEESSTYRSFEALLAIAVFFCFPVPLVPGLPFRRLSVPARLGLAALVLTFVYLL